MTAPRGHREPDSRPSLLSLVVLIVGAVASMATSRDETVVDDEAYARTRMSAADTVALWRVDVSLNEEALPTVGVAGGGEVTLYAGGDARRGREPGTLASYVVPDPEMTDASAVESTGEERIVTNLQCGSGGCTRTMYLVVERRGAGPAEPAFIQISAFGKVTYRMDEAPDGAAMEVTLTELEDFATTTARTDTEVIPPPKARRQLDHEYDVSVTTSVEASLTDPGVIGYAAVWAESRGRGYFDLSPPGAIGDNDAGFDVDRYDQLAFDEGSCSPAAECTQPLDLYFDSPRKVTWWAEARVIFLDQESVPDGATVSMEVNEV